MPKEYIETINGVSYLMIDLGPPQICVLGTNLTNEEINKENEKLRIEWEQQK